LKKQYQQLLQIYHHSERFTEFGGVWESHGKDKNLERFFFLEAPGMRKKQIDNVFYADGDVTVLATRNATIVRPAECDGLVSMGGGGMKAPGYDWLAWAGSAILSQRMLADFLSFAVEIYEKAEYTAVLEEKCIKKKYVTDMTVWNMFIIVATDPSLAEVWKWNFTKHSLPERKHFSYRFCDGQIFGFDHSRGYERGNMSNLLSVHFQGAEGKKLLAGFGATCKSSSSF
jgi:hypothetical protein